LAINIERLPVHGDSTVLRPAKNPHRVDQRKAGKFPPCVRDEVRSERQKRIEIRGCAVSGLKPIFDVEAIPELEFRALADNEDLYAQRLEFVYRVSDTAEELVVVVGFSILVCSEDDLGDGVPSNDRQRFVGSQAAVTAPCTLMTHDRSTTRNGVLQDIVLDRRGGGFDPRGKMGRERISPEKRSGAPLT